MFGDHSVFPLRATAPLLFNFSIRVYPCPSVVESLLWNQCNPWLLSALCFSAFFVVKSHPFSPRHPPFSALNKPNMVFTFLSRPMKTLHLLLCAGLLVLAGVTGCATAQQGAMFRARAGLADRRYT